MRSLVSASLATSFLRDSSASFGDGEPMDQDVLLVLVLPVFAGAVVGGMMLLMGLDDLDDDDAEVVVTSAA